jgi:hypothetical protein
LDRGAAVELAELAIAAVAWRCVTSPKELQAPRSIGTSSG